MILICRVVSNKYFVGGYQHPLKKICQKIQKKTTAPVYAYFTSLPGAKSFLFNATIEIGSDFPFPLHLTGP